MGGRGRYRDNKSGENTDAEIPKDRQKREKPSHTKELGVSEPLVGSTVEDDLS